MFALPMSKPSVKGQYVLFAAWRGQAFLVQQEANRASRYVPKQLLEENEEGAFR